MKYLKEHGPEIAIGLGLSGMVYAAYLAVSATPKALKLIEKKKEEEDVDSLGIVDTVKTAGLCYVPAVITGVLSASCILFASSVNVKRNAAIAAACKLTENAYTEYREKVIETVGEKKEKEVKDAIAKDKIKKHPISNEEIVITNRGETLCYDIISGRYFYSDIEFLRKVENDLNRRMRDEMYISLNDFYYEVGLNEIALGYDLGWDIDKGYIQLEFSTQLSPDGRPCLVVGYADRPTYNYNYR